jgi:spore germination cell wall hydrolase CwlJ-like protein
MLRVLFTLVLSFFIVSTVFAITEKKQPDPLRVKYVHVPDSAKKEIECLAENIYFESAHEPTDGKVAVAFVTLNRVNHHRYPDTICGVVKQKTSKVCQFSWYCEDRPYTMSKNKVLTKTNNKLYNEIVELSTYVYYNYDSMEDPSDGALFYHADYVNPQWKNMIRTAVIGRHIFYQRSDLKNART